MADVRTHLAGGVHDSAWAELLLKHVTQVFGLQQITFFKEIVVMLEVHVKAIVHAVQNCLREGIVISLQICNRFAPLVVPFGGPTRKQYPPTADTVHDVASEMVLGFRAAELRVQLLVQFLQLLQLIHIEHDIGRISKDEGNVTSEKDRSHEILHLACVLYNSVTI